jgi:hypothetical protein
VQHLAPGPARQRRRALEQAELVEPLDDVAHALLRHAGGVRDRGRPAPAIAGTPDVGGLLVEPVRDVMSLVDDDELWTDRAHQRKSLALRSPQMASRHFSPTFAADFTRALATSRQ